MKVVRATSVLAFVAQAAAHGYIYRITADNSVYPGWDVNIDSSINPTPNRIAFGGGYVFPIFDLNSRDVACNRGNKPTPGAIAEVRAGSKVTFHWSRWLYTHKGPITAWMAPYEGDIANINVNELEFFKFAEDTVEDGVWGTVRMIDNTNSTWTATIPADIKPGNYVIRQEIIALHFSIHTKPPFTMVPIGPQFYMTCFNFKVTGSGNATPKGVKFPGGYHKNDPGLHFDVNSTDPYPTVGPALYQSTYDVALEPKEHTIISPTGQGEAADAAYFERQDGARKQLETFISYIVSLGG